ncbi:hypothetical protein HY640_02085 [Candidatus Woesearchaeota archaeon]|nr:hypothetical protein [Candidatus Woesearchaeota archaeon]
MKSIIFAILILITVMGSVSYVLVTEKTESRTVVSAEGSSSVQPQAPEHEPVNTSSVPEVAGE